jgi:uncharacterized protein (DUF302 family)
MEYQRSISTDPPYAEAVTRTREAYIILGARNPKLAHQALEVDRSIGVLLPCNVVVSGHGEGSTVQILDPQIMASVTELPGLQPLADDASTRLQAVLDRLSRGEQ